MIGIEKLIARLFGRQVVWLQDSDGECVKRWARPTPFGLVASRAGYGVAKVILNPDGSVTGRMYVVSWRPA